MSDSNWADHADEVDSSSPLYANFLRRRNSESAQHRTIVRFGDPRNQSFLAKIKKTLHIYKTGDRLSKIAHKHYGDSRYWWVLAWFNSKPTDFHCKIGDIIEVPKPLDEVLIQYRERADL